MFCFFKKKILKVKVKFFNLNATVDSSGNAEADMPMPRFPNGQEQVIYSRYYCYNYESVTRRKWELSNDLFLYSILKKIGLFISVKYYKSKYLKKHRSSISAVESKTMRERVLFNICTVVFEDGIVNNQEILQRFTWGDLS